MASEIIKKLKKQVAVLVLIVVCMGIALTISVNYNYKSYIKSKKTVEIMKSFDADIPRDVVQAVKRRKGKTK